MDTLNYTVLTKGIRRDSTEYTEEQFKGLVDTMTPSQASAIWGVLHEKSSSKEVAKHKIQLAIILWKYLR